MRYLALIVALLCGSYTLQAQAYDTTVDSTVQRSSMPTIALNLPFIGIMELETPSYVFQKATMLFQIPTLNKKQINVTFPEVDSLVSVRGLQVKADSLEVKG